MKVSELLPRVQNNLSQLGGAGVQVYSQDTIIEKIITSFNMMFTRYFWDEYTYWQAGTLDGTEGVVVENADTWQHGPLVRFIDIEIVKRDANGARALAVLPRHMDPFHVQGTSPKYIMPFEIDPHKVFKVVPASSTGRVLIRYRTRPTNIDIDTELLLDEELLKLAATWQYLADDGTNPDATNAAFAMVQSRETVLRAVTSHAPVPLTGYDFDPTAWYG